MKSESGDVEQTSLIKNASLDHLLKRSTKIKQEVEQSAGELTSINATFKKDNRARVSVKEIQAAIVQNERVEHNVEKSADDLNQVNTALVDVMDERINIEFELEDAKVDLVQVRKELRKSQDNESEARKMSLKDKLTNIPNRASFEMALEQGVAESRRHGWKFAVLFIDVDKFKHINDTYGHDLGDKVLLMVADCLRSSVRDEDTACRWGGDEFMCLLLEIKKESDVNHFAQKLVNRIAEPCDFDGISLSVQTSIGIAIFPQDGETTDSLIKNADIAMYKAKVAKNRVFLFSESSRD